MRFNSLQTGKPFRTILYCIISRIYTINRFNSLQTGKPFRTVGRTVGGRCSLHEVSIPFTRESPFGRTCIMIPSEWEQSVSIPFKRESPFGLKHLCTIRLGTMVSIPFKRESPFGRQNCIRWQHGLCQWVSIPFKRESPFGRKELAIPSTTTMFQFPSNGKALSDHPPWSSTYGKLSFNSLQTGKPFRTGCHQSWRWPLYVSIPFKRESPFGRHHHLRKRETISRVSIPFKRESPFGQEMTQNALVNLERVSIPFKRESPFGPAQVARR